MHHIHGTYSKSGSEFLTQGGWCCLGHTNTQRTDPAFMVPWHGIQSLHCPMMRSGYWRPKVNYQWLDFIKGDLPNWGLSQGGDGWAETGTPLISATQAFDFSKIKTCVWLMQQFSKHAGTWEGRSTDNDYFSSQSNKCAQGKYSKRRQKRHTCNKLLTSCHVADSQSDPERSACNQWLRLTHNRMGKETFQTRDMPCHKLLTDPVYTDISNPCTEGNTRSWHTYQLLSTKIYINCFILLPFFMSWSKNIRLLLCSLKVIIAGVSRTGHNKRLH